MDKYEREANRTDYHPNVQQDLFRARKELKAYRLKLQRNGVKDMSKKEEKVWQYLLANRKADYAEVAEACGVDIEFVKRLETVSGQKTGVKKLPTPQQIVADI